MSSDWVQLLLGALLFGAALVAAMTAPAPVHIVAAIVCLASMVLAVTAIGAVVTGYATAESVALAIFFLLAGIVGGYWTAAAALPLLVRRKARLPHHAAIVPADTRDTTVVTLLAAAQPERYSARAVATSQHLLVESAGVHIPTTAAPFMYLSEKTRYRAIGGALPAQEMARSIAAGLQDRLASRGHDCRVVNSWTPVGASLSEVADDALQEGTQRVVVASLGSHLTIQAAHAFRELDETRTSQPSPTIIRTDPLWHSTSLARILADRVLEHASDTPCDRLGVVLVADGQPPAWGVTHPGLDEQENYFAQRVRLHLGEHGVDERHVRMGWLEWQVPDVTESVRHVAALGCTRIVVAPGLIPLPSLAAAIDIQHAVRMARLNETVSVAVLPTWGDDDAVVEALADSVEAALDRA